jgi:hypothetical protein
MAPRATVYGTIIGTTLITLVIVLVIAGLFTSMTFAPSQSHTALELTDNQSQPVLSAGQWTPVAFHRQVKASPDWRFTSASGPVHCLRSGHYWAYISVHSEPDTSTWNASEAPPYYCRQCRIDPMEIRALRQRGSQLRELEGSLTSGSFGALSKIFVLEAQLDDNLYFQFRSLCADARLVLGVPQGTTVGVTSYPTCATLTLIPV